MSLSDVFCCMILRILPRTTQARYFCMSAARYRTHRHISQCVFSAVSRLAVTTFPVATYVCHQYSKHLLLEQKANKNSSRLPDLGYTYMHLPIGLLDLP